MTLITYDISNNKTRNKLYKFLEKSGFSLQKSVFEINLSKKEEKKIVLDIKNNFIRRLKNNDSILIIPIKPQSEKQIIKLGSIKDLIGYQTLID